MAEDIRLFKLVTGEVVIGNYDANTDSISEVAQLQSAPLKQGGVQLMIIPYGVPFENTLCGTIEGKNIIYRYQETPQEIKAKYLEVSANITAQGGMGKLQFGVNPPPAQEKVVKN